MIQALLLLESEPVAGDSIVLMDGGSLNLYVLICRLNRVVRVDARLDSVINVVWRHLSHACPVRVLQ